MSGAVPGTARMCVSCGRAISFDANVCPYCGHDYRIQAYAMAPPRKSNLPLVAGILILIAGILAIGMGAFMFTVDAEDIVRWDVKLPDEMTAEDVVDALSVCGVLTVVFGVIAIIGGYFGLVRKHLPLVLVGAIFGIMGIGFLVGAGLAVVGLVLLFLSRNEFDRTGGAWPQAPQSEPWIKS